jgi:hypothetical protein
MAHIMFRFDLETGTDAAEEERDTPEAILDDVDDGDDVVEEGDSFVEPDSSSSIDDI